MPIGSKTKELWSNPLFRERMSRIHRESSRKHGFTTGDVSFYYRWQNMKQRVLNPKNLSYSHYGGRGIKICKKWLSFEGFKEDLYKKYLIHVKEFGIKETSLDRIDNDGDYKKSNCKWSTREEQMDNQRPLKKIRCQRCFKMIVSMGRQQKYCGSIKNKSGCSYEIKMIRDKGYFAEKLKEKLQ